MGRLVELAKEGAIVLADDDPVQLALGRQATELVTLTPEEADLLDDAREVIDQALSIALMGLREDNHRGMPETDEELDAMRGAIESCMAEIFAHVAGKRRAKRRDSLAPVVSEIVPDTCLLSEEEAARAEAAIDDLRRCVHLRRAS